MNNSNLMLSFRNSETTAFGTFITAVLVKWDFHIRFMQLTFMRESEFHISNIKATLNPLALIICFYSQNTLCLFVKSICMVQVFRGEKQWKTISLNHI